MFSLPVGDGTNALVQGPLDPSLPLVILLPGFGATAADMTAPLSTRSYAAFDKNASFPYADAGLQISPPLTPVAGYFSDPTLASVTSWDDALLAAGFSTVSYEPAQPVGLIGPNVTQLASFAAGSLSTDARVSRLPLAILAHSRGGLVARALLGGAGANPALAAFMTRMRAVITLHSPHMGSSLATLAGMVDTVVARVQMMIATLGLAPLPQLTTLRAFVGSPAIAELAPGSATLNAIAAAEPVPGIAFHTFGGNSTVLMRLWQRAYTPDSYLPLPLPIPLFHWGTAGVPLGFLLNAATFLPSQILLPLPVMTEAIAAMATLAGLAPELADGQGDFLVTDASAHLPFSASRTTNALNHAEALWDPTLQVQVISLLAGLRVILPSHRARAAIAPFPASEVAANHVVTATDTVTGADVPGVVSVTDASGREVLSARTGPPGFGFAFKPTLQRTRVFDPETRHWVIETNEIFPSVRVKFDDASYASVGVDLGL